MAEVTLHELESAARGMGFRAEVTMTGGNVMGMTLEVDGAHALVSLGEGWTSGDTWHVSLDGDTRERLGELSAEDLPVSGDAEQTVRDAVAWVRNTVWGAPTADGDRAPAVELRPVCRGVAGVVSIAGTVTYPGEGARHVSFAGSVYGGPVAYTFELSDGRQTSGFVAEANTRFGLPFHRDPAEWTRRFFA